MSTDDRTVAGMNLPDAICGAFEEYLRLNPQAFVSIWIDTDHQFVCRIEGVIKPVEGVGNSMGAAYQAVLQAAGYFESARR